MVMMGWVTLAPGTLADACGRTLARMMGAVVCQFHPCPGTCVQHCGLHRAINSRFTPWRPPGRMLPALPLDPASMENRVPRSVHPLIRTTLLSAALALAIAAPIAAQNNKLPDIGSSAGEVLGPAQQSEYGAMTLSQLRHYGYVLDDPLLEGWLQGVGNRLAAASDKPRQQFTFFLLRDRQINAFATLGGYVATNAGLVLAAQREDQVASVLSHEIAHVTQDHVLRAVERAQRDSVPILLAMLGAIVVAQKAGGNSSDDATMAAVTGAQSLLYQRQIDYTRDNEAEADRVGMQTLFRSVYDPKAMAEFFTTLQSWVRANQGGERERTPDYLQTHPVTVTRISEAKQRAAQMPARPTFSAPAAT